MVSREICCHCCPHAVAGANFCDYLLRPSSVVSICQSPFLDNALCCFSICGRGWENCDKQSIFTGVVTDACHGKLLKAPRDPWARFGLSFGDNGSTNKPMGSYVAPNTPMVS